MKKTTHKYTGWLLLLVAVAMMASGCSGSVTTANFQDMVMASEVDEDTNSAVTVQEVFAVGDPVIYAVGRLENAPEGTVAKASWIYLDLDPEYLIDEAEITAEEINSSVVFSLSRPDNGWPVGDYRVDLYIDGELEESIPFSVE